MCQVAKTQDAEKARLETLEIAREEATLDISKARFERNTTHLNDYNRGADTATGRVIISRLCAPLADAIQEFLDPVVKVKGWNAGNKAKIRTVLAALNLSPEEIAYVTVKAALNEYFRPDSAGLLSRHASQVVEALLVSAEFREYQMTAPKEAIYLVKKIVSKKGSLNNRYGVSVMEQARNQIDLPEKIKLNSDKIQVGTKLVELLIESTGAFRLKKEYRGKNDTPYTLQASDELVTLIKTCADKFAELQPQYQIMLVPPKPWKGLFGGGYLLPLQSLHPALVKCGRKDIRALKNYPMPHVLEAVNIVQETRWKINSKIFDIAKIIWDCGGGRAGICERDERQVPTPPWGDETFSKEAFKQWKDAHVEEYRCWSDRAQAVYKHNKHCGASRIRVAYQLRIAKENLGYDALYFPWTCDFRGRLYALPSYVNPQADDLGKALLTFADAKPLGLIGAYWLKIHLANCAGVDKVSFEERLKWVEENKANILWSAKDPLSCHWWEDKDSPFMFLAACMEYADYVKYGPDYACSLPIAMDGTCNGLQHLSAMLRDPVGGAAVNLVPSIKPSDIYTEVLVVLKRRVAHDKTTSEDAKVRLIAEAWEPHLDRSITKRPVMTTPYGVSRFGISEQILGQIYDKNLFRGYAVKANEFAKYLTDQIRQAIAEVITAAPEAMGWMQESARIIANADDDAHGIAWTVPGSGFRVIQRYCEDAREVINTFIGTQRVRMCTGDVLEDSISPRRQVSGISPNIIHSLDASMLVQTVRTLHRQGITHFALIHDSYGCHACDIDVLHQVLRSEFVKIYQDRNVLSELKQAWEQMYDVKLPVLPELNKLDIVMVNKSKYFFA